MSNFSDEIKELIESVGEEAKEAGVESFTEYINYGAERRQIIADAFSANAADKNEIAKQEILNIRAKAATLATEKADALDDAAVAVATKAFNAFDDLLLTYLASL